ncbi:uncharacterized protein [Diabrotica undecimpunctata]|uniref:uncharacterized protein n=1 Tax=Diabrotica undecimpunctata TaxID=50387 RepID=UPI003B63339E
MDSAKLVERGCLVMVIAAVNPIGNLLLPMIIFPRVHFKERMLFGRPVGCIGTAYQSGWSNEESFLMFLDHFMNAVKSSKDERLLLLLDNHQIHFSPTIFDKASDRGIVIATFPTHKSNRLQPLDHHYMVD